MRSPFHKLVAKLVYWFGDLRRIDKFPGFTTAKMGHDISLDEVMREAVPLLQPGDIILHRDKWYAGNLWIGGFMIHAGVYVGDHYCVEAISEGVVKRHVAYILHSDYAMILRPRFKDNAEREKAVREALEWAELCIGCKYDPYFQFDIEIERKALNLGLQKETRLACTEVALLCYADYEEQLKIKRRRNVNIITRIASWAGVNFGREVVNADFYLTDQFDLVWRSRNTTPAWAKHHKCSEEYQERLKEPA
jgi:hypothetical protein